MKVFHTSLAVIALVSAAGTSHAALYDRGNGLIYDSSLNITWLQDANYAQTSGYAQAHGGSVHGSMTWDQATTWAANLNYAGQTGWRLASAGLNGNTNFSYDGTTDLGYNNTRSEIGHLFTELGNISAFNTSGAAQSGSGLTNSSFVDAKAGKIDSFLNLQNSLYWEAEMFAPDPVEAWIFGTEYGSQYYDLRSDGYYAWAVHAGDVSAVPVPAAGWLLGSGLIGLTGLARKRKTA